MNALKFLKNATGISMVEVMMAVSVMGGLSLTVAQLMKNTSESTKQNEAKQENVNFKGLLQDTLNNTTACVGTFGTVMTPANVTALSGSPTASVTIPNVKDKTLAIKYSTVSTNIQPLTITSMILTNYNSGAFTGDFLVNATFKKSTNNIVMVKPIRIPINFSFTGTTLTACSTMAVGGEWMLGGNAGTVDGTDYVGTSDDVPLNFRVNAQKSGRIDNVGQTFLGYQAGANFPYGTSGTAFGYRALQNNTSGAMNTAVGMGALMSNVSGGTNTALGSGSLAYLTSGSSNTAVGYYAAYRTSGSNNTGVGTMAIYGTSGSDNVALGVNAGRYNSNGSYNTFIGTNSALALTTGTNNIFLGYGAGTGVVNTSNRLFIETSGSATPLIGGNFLAGSRMVSIDGKLGIGTSTPGTPSTPVVATAGVTQLHVTGGKTILDQEAWVAIPFGAGWGACSYSANAVPKYFKDSVGVVHLKGCIRATTDKAAGGMSLSFYLPAGYGSQANAGYLGPLPRRNATTMGYPTTGSNCWIYFDGGTSTNFWMYSDTAWPAASGQNGCDLNGVTWRGDI